MKSGTPMRRWVVLPAVFLLFGFEAIPSEARQAPRRPLGEAVSELMGPPRGPVFPGGPVIQTPRLRWQESPQERESFWKTPWPYLIIGGAVAIGVAVAGGDASMTASAAPPSDMTPAAGSATVRFVYFASTSRSNLPPGAQDCVDLVGQTHIHASWRNFSRFDMQPVGSDRWEFSFEDVPTGQRQSIRVNDPNRCTENPTGAVTENVQADGVPLVDIVDTPGSGTEPGFAFAVDGAGRVTP